jgi:hypothetical protein
MLKGNTCCEKRFFPLPLRRGQPAGSNPAQTAVFPALGLLPKLERAFILAPSPGE